MMGRNSSPFWSLRAICDRSRFGPPMSPPRRSEPWQARQFTSKSALPRAMSVGSPGGRCCAGKVAGPRPRPPPCWAAPPAGAPCPCPVRPVRAAGPRPGRPRVPARPRARAPRASAHQQRQRNSSCLAFTHLVGSYAKYETPNDMRLPTGEDRARPRRGQSPFPQFHAKRGQSSAWIRRSSVPSCGRTVEKGSVPYFTVMVIFSDITGFSCGVCR